MGKASRGSKKQALRRAAISADHDDLIQRESKEERTGGPLEAVPDSALFFVDTAKDVKIQRKVDRYRNKSLRFESLFQRDSLVAPVSWTKRRKDVPGGEVVLPPGVKSVRKADNGELATKKIGRKVSEKKRRREADPWRPEDGETEDTALEGSTKKGSKKSKGASGVGRAEKSHKAAPAVEVDGPGCSYNPSYQDHQDALGKAVAHEMGKEYAKILQPQAPKLTVESDGTELDEESKYFLEVGGGEEDAEEEEGEEDGMLLGIARPVQVKKLSRADLNRRLRRKAAEAAAKKSAGKKRQREELGRLKEVESEVIEETMETEKRRVRREVAREEKQASLPPKLGPHRFIPDPVHVLLTEELTGSLRTVKGCETLTLERFKSLQRRGLVEPRVPVRRRKAKNVRIVEQGTQGRREREMHSEIEAMRAARKLNANKNSNKNSNSELAIIE